MLTKIHWLTFVLISIAFIINPQNPTASTTPDVKYEGKRLSVHADGVVLDQLLSMVAEQTGTQFSYDDLVADIDVYANFENNSLADGIRRILRQFNYAVIYDGSGHVKSVLVLNGQGASSKSPGSQTGLFASQLQNDMYEILETHPDQLEAPPNDMFATHPDQEDTTPFSAQGSAQDAGDQDSAPPGVDENDTPPQGEESPSPMVDPDVSPKTGEETLKPVVDPNVTPPPGEKPLEQEPKAESTFPSDTQEQAVPEANSKSSSMD